MKISVVMTTYKEKEEHLRKAIESILNQTFTEFEFIIILDNPTNQLHKDIIEQYKVRDSRIKFYINESNIGLALSLNKGIDIAKGKYIARMDADDVSMPNRFEKEYIYLEVHPEVSVVSSNAIDIDENDNILRYGSKLPKSKEIIDKVMRYSSLVIHPSVMFRKNDIIKIGCYRNFVTAQDYDLWLRVISSGLSIGLIDENLLKYRVGTENISHTKALKQWLSSKYQRLLFKERRKKGNDSFTAENFEKYLVKHKCYDEKKQLQFNKGKKMFETSMQYSKQGKKIEACFCLLNSFFCHKEMIYMFYNIAICKLIKYKEK